MELSNNKYLIREAILSTNEYFSLIYGKKLNRVIKSTEFLREYENQIKNIFNFNYNIGQKVLVNDFNKESKPSMFLDKVFRNNYCNF